MKKQYDGMLQGPLLGNMIVYTVPIILTSVLQLLFNAADLVVVGQFCGSISVAAVGATGAITGLIVNLFIGLSVGAGVTVAVALGAKDDEMVHRTVHTALPAAIVSGLMLTFVGLCLSEPLLRLMGTPEKVLKLSAVYMRIYFCGISFTMVYNFCASILRAAGDTKSPLIFLTISGIINVVLNIIFVTRFDMNVAGVSLATVISQAISAVLVVITLMRRNDACRLSLGKMRFYKAQLMRIIRVGLPAGIQSSLFSISNVLIQSSINSFGEVLMSGDAAARNLEGFIYVILNGFAQTAVNYIAKNVGARQYKRAYKVLWLCFVCVIVVGFCLALIVCFAGEMLLSIYITDSQEAIAYGMRRLMWVAIPYFICGLMDVSTGALRGLGASVTPMLISILGVCGIRIGWIMTIFRIPAFHSSTCLYLSYPVSWFITLAIQFTAFMLIYKKKTKNPLFTS